MIIIRYESRDALYSQVDCKDKSRLMVKQTKQISYWGKTRNREFDAYIKSKTIKSQYGNS